MKHLKIVFSIVLLSFVFILNGCGGGSGGGGSSSNPSPTPTPTTVPVITTFAINTYSGVIIGNKIAITLPYGTDVTTLSAVFTAPGSIVTLNGIPQISGVSTNDYSHPVVFTVTPISGNTSSSARAITKSSTASTTYTVTVTVAPITAKAITAFSLKTPSSTSATSGIISNFNISVVMPFGTNVTALAAVLTSSGVRVTVNDVLQANDGTVNDFTNPVTYTVIAADGSTQNYIVTVTVASATSDDIIAFSLNGTPGVISQGGLSQSIVVKVPYGTNLNGLVAEFITTGVSVAINSVPQVSDTTQNDFTNSLTYIVTAANGSIQSYTVTVIVSASSSNFINSFSFGNIAGVITGQNIAVTVPFGTNVKALVASFTTTGVSVTVGGIEQTSTLTSNDFTSPVVYTVAAADGTTQIYTVTVTVASASNNAITAFSFGTTAGVITNQNITVQMPFGTDVTSLIAKFTTSGVRVSVGTVTQVSGTTVNNFTTPVSYVVTASDGSIATYVVTVTVAHASANAITSYSIAGTPGVITGLNIAVTVPSGTDPTLLVATFTTTGASVTVNGLTQFSGTTSNNFTIPVTYMVTAADGTTQNYIVTVTVAPSSAKAITTFLISGNIGVISGFNIAVTMPFGTDVTDLIATFTTTGASVLVNKTPQTSGSTHNNFTSPVTYIVTAGDGTTQNYTVTVNATSNVWTWMSGTSSEKQSSVYGKVTVTDPSNMPGNRNSGSTWSDSSGNLWFFGGNGFNDPISTTVGSWSDLWKYNISTGYWTWMSGPNVMQQTGTYGTQGVESASYIPSSRAFSMSWTDNSGNLWLFGGHEQDASAAGPINDLWKYNISTGYWTWMSGSSSNLESGVYNTQGVPGPTSVPGAREASVTWLDASGKLWLFGGLGVDSVGTFANLNDLWKFDPAIGINGEWTWMGGSAFANQNGTYGTQGTPSTGNIPGARTQGISWIDSQGNFWLFGGSGRAATSGNGSLNDLWKYNPSNGTWTWVSGLSTRNGVAVYGTQGTPSTSNIPGSRQGSTSWIDSSGNLWLFGGFGKTTIINNSSLNDLWKFNPSDGTWTWVSGSNSGNASGVYGTITVPAASNVAGAREYGMYWTDQSGNLWLFGGIDPSNLELNDLWRYHP